MKVNEISFRRTFSSAGTLFIYLGKKNFFTVPPPPITTFCGQLILDVKQHVWSIYADVSLRLDFINPTFAPTLVYIRRSIFGWGAACPLSTLSQVALDFNFCDLLMEILTPHTASLLAWLAQDRILQRGAYNKQFDLGSCACRYCNF